ncbi:MAG: acetyl-CoA carboxylase carboxyltransferase subunit alpha [Xanthomonadales bacterium]|nr:acetyl-CoA carboxylase carboxyltransferase subunit alpha [Xanthomonadales bacterium]
MGPNAMDFEQPLNALREQIAALEQSGRPAEEIASELASLRHSLEVRSRQIYAELSPWQITQVARHPQRPHALDYIQAITSEFHELAGDRAFADDPAIVGGLARIDGQPVVLLGQQKGRDTKQKVRRNFGMPRPEGYRKALRLMQLAERFRLPLLTLIDTPGAYPGVGAEERGQSEAIAKNLEVLSQLEVPVLCVVIGEGGSGGALAIGVGDRVLMLQHAVYSVISPEGCASILWKSADYAESAAQALKVSAPQLLELGLIDGVIPEPLGGAHRDPAAMAATLKSTVITELAGITRLDSAARLDARYRRLRGHGAWEQAA